MLIEDDVHGQLVAAELRDTGSAVDWSSDAASGLRKFAAIPHSLITLDLNLPDLEGLQVCEQIRSADRLTPILMLTARDQQDVSRGLELEEFDLLLLFAKSPGRPFMIETVWGVGYRFAAHLTWKNAVSNRY